MLSQKGMSLRLSLKSHLRYVMAGLFTTNIVRRVTVIPVRVMAIITQAALNQNHEILQTQSS